MRLSKTHPGIDLDTWQPQKARPAPSSDYRPVRTAFPAFESSPHMPAATKSPNLVKRAGKKLQTFILNKELYGLGSPMKSYYARAMNCCNEIRQEGKTFTANYCGCRSCKICCDIRQSKLTEKYHEIIGSFKHKRFVTLTVRNITDDVDELKWLQGDMFKHHRRVQDLLRKHGINILGIRKYEPIPAKDLNGFHPHFHWVIDGSITEEKICEVWFTQKLCPDTLEKMIDGWVWGTERTPDYSYTGWIEKYKPYSEETAANKIEMLASMKGEMLVQLWLKKYKGFADRKGQDVRNVTPGTEAELFKYTTKLLVKTKNNTDVVPLRLLDMVFNATKGVRTIQVTGYVTSRPREVLKSETNPTGEKIMIDYRRVPKQFFIDCEFAQIGSVAPLQNTISGIAPAGAGYKLVKRISNYYRKLLSYLTYKGFTEIEDADIEDDLTAQDYADAQDCSTVFCWRGENWYCIHNGQPLTTYKADERIGRLLESFAYD